MIKLRVLRLALIAGVLAFGASSWYLRRLGSAPEPLADPSLLLLGGRVVWGVALAGVSLLFLRTRQTINAAHYRTLSIIGWALGEATAIYGGVVYLLAGTPFWYQLGVGFMAVTFLAFPG